MSNTTELTRANKATAFWGGNGIAVGNFYRTHDKVAEIRSDSDIVKNAGFTFPESTEEVQVTAQDKLAAFKNFICANAAAFGIQYDPVDRRNDEYKFPNKYNEENFGEYGRKMVISALQAVVDKLQNNVISKMVSAGNLPEGSTIDYGVGEQGTVSVDEKYGNGNIKYGKATYDVAFQVGDKQVKTSITADLVSGQIKKPRELAGGISLTMASVKTFLTDNGVIPVVEKPKKEPKDDGDTEPVEAGVAAGDDIAKDVKEDKSGKAGKADAKASK